MRKKLTKKKAALKSRTSRSSKALLMKAEKIKLLIIDVDGVMTDVPEVLLDVLANH